MIGIICALNKEEDAILTKMHHVRAGSINNTIIHTGILNGVEVTTCLSGVGKVNAAISTTILITQLKVDKIINVGIAGGCHKYIKANDTIIASKVSQWDFNDEFYEPKRGEYRKFDYDSMTCYANEQMNESIVKSCPEVIVGPMVTADQFVVDDQQYATINKYYPEALCCDMEAGAIAMACFRQRIPFAIIRTISDTSNDADVKIDFNDFAEHACKKAAEIIEKAITEI